MVESSARPNAGIYDCRRFYIVFDRLIREFHESWEILDGFYFGLAWSGIAAVASVIVFSLIILIFKFPFDIHWFIPVDFVTNFEQWKNTPQEARCW